MRPSNLKKYDMPPVPPTSAKSIRKGPVGDCDDRFHSARGGFVDPLTLGGGSSARRDALGEGAALGDRLRTSPEGMGYEVAGGRSKTPSGGVMALLKMIIRCLETRVGFSFFRAFF